MNKSDFFYLQDELTPFYESYFHDDLSMGTSQFTFFETTESPSSETPTLPENIPTFPEQPQPYREESPISFVHYTNPYSKQQDQAAFSITQHPQFRLYPKETKKFEDSQQPYQQVFTVITPQINPNPNSQTKNPANKRKREEDPSYDHLCGYFDYTLEAKTKIKKFGGDRQPDLEFARKVKKPRLTESLNDQQIVQTDSKTPQQPLINIPLIADELKDLINKRRNEIRILELQTMKLIGCCEILNNSNNNYKKQLNNTQIINSYAEKIILTDFTCEIENKNFEDIQNHANQLKERISELKTIQTEMLNIFQKLNFGQF